MSVPATLRTREPRPVSRLELLLPLEESLFDDGFGVFRSGEIESVSSSNDGGEGDREGKEG
jgi:hypothetical protein